MSWLYKALQALLDCFASGFSANRTQAYNSLRILNNLYKKLKIKATHKLFQTNKPGLMNSNLKINSNAISNIHKLFIIRRISKFSSKKKKTIN